MPRLARRVSRPLAPCALIACAFLMLAGCDSRPEAPVLRDAPVYKNEREGFRFLVPNGWIQTASSVLPKGELKGETFLVRYRMNTPEQGASLMIIATEADEVPDLEKYHSEPSFRVEKWTLVEAAETIKLDERPAQRIAYSGVMANRPMAKEVIAFQNGSRMYHFIGLYWDTDQKAREQIRRALGSIVWE